MGKKTHVRIFLLFFLTTFTVVGHDVTWVNLALNQQVAASSAEEPAAAALDGNHESYWQSAGTVGTHWLEVDLENAHTIDRIVLPLVQGADSLVAEVWTGEQWVVVGSLPQDNPMISFEPVQVQKLRLRSIRGQQLRIYEVQVFAYDPQPVFVNQVGYDTEKPKRFTAPLAKELSAFKVVREGETVALFEGKINQHIGEFTGFRPDEPGPYQVIVQGEMHSGISVPFRIASGIIESVAYQPAIDFMVDVRCWFGDSRTYNPSDSSADCPNLGVAWRDSHQFSFEIPSLLNLYSANPSAFSIDRMPVQGLYLGLREELPENTPEIVRLIYWAVDIYLRGEVNHTLLKEQLAYFLYAYPYLKEYIPEAVYHEAKEYLFSIWGEENINRWQWYDIEHSGNLFRIYDFIGTGKGQFPPGHSIVPNLMMHEVAKREGEDATPYFQAAYGQAKWLLKNLDWSDPSTTKGQRQGEHITITALSYFLENYPQRAPDGIADKIESWADVMISRSNNMWDYRKYSDEKWIIPSINTDKGFGGESENGFNEVGNITGFPAPALAAASHVADANKKARLEEMALAYVDHIFGRNPTGRHFGFDAIADFEGVDVGWYKEWQGGAGMLQTARGVLDGSPKETTYPYNPRAGDPGHSEGWVTFNTAWNTGLAYLSSSSIEVEVYDQDFSKRISKVKRGDVIGIELTAPLNFDDNQSEQAEVLVNFGGKCLAVQLNEVSEASSVFRATFQVSEEIPEKLTISYGFGWHEKKGELLVR